MEPRAGDPAPTVLVFVVGRKTAGEGGAGDGAFVGGDEWVVYVGMVGLVESRWAFKVVFRVVSRAAVSRLVEGEVFSGWSAGVGAGSRLPEGRPAS